MGKEATWGWRDVCGDFSTDQSAELPASRGVIEFACDRWEILCKQQVVLGGGEEAMSSEAAIKWAVFDTRDRSIEVVHWKRK